MQCDLCGNQTKLYNAVVEGSIVDVCNSCLKFGKELEKKDNFDVEKLIKVKKRIKEEETDFLSGNYNEIIKKSREKLNLTQEELAKKINERLHAIQKLEKKSMKPNDKLIRKLESFFGVKLTEKYDYNEIDIKTKSSSL